MKVVQTGVRFDVARNVCSLKHAQIKLMKTFHLLTVRLLAALVFFAVAANSWAAVVVSPLGSSASVQSSSSMSFTVPAGTNRLLVVMASDDDSATISAVKFGTSALTRVREQTQESAAVDGIWYLAMGTSASPTMATISVTIAAAPASFVAAQVYQNVDQTTPMNGAMSELITPGPNAASNLTIASASGDLVVDVCDVYDQINLNLPTAAGGQTVVHTQSIPGEFAFYRTSTKPGAASVSMGWTSTATDMIHVAANIKRAVVDTTTLAPTLILPLENARTASPITVSYSLPEAALAGSVEIKFHDFMQSVEVFLTPGAGGGTTGAHTFPINAGNPGASSGIVSTTGGPIVDGHYTVLISYQDALGNPREYDYHFNVTVDVTAPETSIISGPPQFANSTSAAFSFGSNEEGVTYQASLDSGVPQNVAGTINYSGLSEGAHTLSVRAIDPVGNSDATPATSLWRVDLTPPVVSPNGNIETTATSPDGAVVDFDYGATDETGLLGVSASPAPGSVFPIGVTEVDVMATDRAGNVAHGYFTVTVFPPAQDDVVHDVLFTKGDVLPGAGSDPRIPAGATWFRFGVPAVDADGRVAMLAKWKNPPGSPSSTGSGLFVNGQLRLAVGAEVPGVLGATFKKFRDPVIASDYLATIATLAGVDAAEDSAVIRVGPAGEVTLLAREGSTATSSDGATFKTFKSVAIGGEIGSVIAATANPSFIVILPPPDEPVGVLYTATLTKETGTPAVTSATDFGAWHFRNAATTLVVREGVSTANGFASLETAKSFRILATASGSPGQGRWQVGAAAATFNAVSSLGTKYLLGWTVDQGLQAANSQGNPVGSLMPGATWASFGAVSETDRMSFTGVLDKDGTPSAETKGVFVEASGGWSRVAYSTGPTGIAGVTFKSFKDVVLASNGGGLAFPAVLQGLDVVKENDFSLWWRPPGEDLTLLAREGKPAVGGGMWKAFTSLAIAGGETGPIFLATLLQGVDGIDKTNDVGVWATDGAGALRLLFREGDTIASGKQVKNFVVLKAVSGSPGTTHAFNSRAQVLWRVTFLDGRSAIVRTTVPTGVIISKS